MTRSIDADDLKNKFWHGDLVRNKEMYHISEIMYTIDNAPTVEERPQGEWIDDGGYFECSICKSLCFYPSQFCPDCGADMREGDE